MLTVVTWKWGDLFSADYVNRSYSMFQRHLRIEHRFVCVTDEPWGLDPRIGFVPLPRPLADQRCARRLAMHDWDFIEDAGLAGERILQVDLDVVLVDDITPLVTNRVVGGEPYVFWKVGYADVFSGSFQLYDAGVLNPMWREFAEDPARVLKVARPRGVGSDQDVLNRYLGDRPPRFHWVDQDGFVVYFGKGYERFGGPGPATLPPGARLVVLGSADKHVMDERAYPWVEEHWR